MNKPIVEPADVPVLSMVDIVKVFGSVAAVDHVSIDVRAGKILALLGENGAGKSTLIKILAGVYKRDSGAIRFHGEEIASAAAIGERGSQPIAFIHQDLGLIEWMTVAENMAFTMGFPRRAGLVDWGQVRRRADAALKAVGTDIDPDARVFELSRTEKSLLAIARAVAVDAEILVLDEPTASLPADDVKHLFEVLERLRERGVGMIYVTHRLDEVVEIADEVCVMRDGRWIAGGATSQYDVRDLVQLIVGAKGRESRRQALPVGAPIMLEVDDLVVGDTGPVSFSLQRGEMVALVGLRGAGQEEIGRCLFGKRIAAAGRIEIDGKPVSPRSPTEAIAKGISLVAGDRIGESLVMTMSVRENLFLNPCTLGLSPMAPYGTATEVRNAWEEVTRFDVRPRLIDIDVSSLSGGNQQKVVIARWMKLGTPVLILEDPTAGVDVGARAEIYDLLNEALAKGIAVLVVSMDFEEIAHICNRALVFNRGKVVGELKNQDVTFANLLELACGDGSGASTRIAEAV